MELRTKDLKIALDDTYPIIRDDVGNQRTLTLTILNPLQPECMDVPKAKKICERRVVFSGTIEPTHGLEPGVPVENVLAFIETGREA